jgi:hypothetical protein
VFPDGRIVVADEGHGRLVFLRPTKSGLEFEEDLKVDGFPSDLCTMGSRLFVLSLQRGTVVHEIDSDGSVLQSTRCPVSSSFSPASFGDRQVLWAGTSGRRSTALRRSGPKNALSR